MRLDRALIADLRAVLRSRAVQLFLLIELIAGAVFIDRRGGGTVGTVVLIWVGMLILAFFAWWSGRDRWAHPEPDAVPGAMARSVFALAAALGMVVWGFRISIAIGFVLFACGLGGWLWSAWRTSGFRGLRDRLTRDPRPFIPLFLLIGLPRLLVSGPGYLVGVLLALPSGIGQQLVYLLGLFAPLEAVRRHADIAAVGSALVFGLIHVPMLVEPNEGDLVAAFANGVLFQASVGLIACLAFVRHRAAVPIGVAHALAIG